MANDCIITKYNEASINNDLLKFGEIRFKIDRATSSDATLQVVSTKTCVIRTIEGSFKDGTKEYTIQGSGGVILVFDNEALISIDPAYDLTALSAPTASDITLDTSIIKYSSNLLVFSALDAGNGKITGKISDFANCANVLTSLTVGAQNLKRNFVFDEMPSFPALGQIEISNSNLIATSALAGKCSALYSIKSLLMSGDVSELAFMRNNISASHKGNIYCASSANNLTGTVESIVGDNSATYCNWTRISLPSTITIRSATKSALESAGCTVSGVTVIE